MSPCNRYAVVNDFPPSCLLLGILQRLQWDVHFLHESVPCGFFKYVSQFSVIHMYCIHFKDVSFEDYDQVLLRSPQTSSMWLDVEIILTLDNSFSKLGGCGILPVLPYRITDWLGHNSHPTVDDRLQNQNIEGT